MRWKLMFQIGLTVARPTFARIVAAIENLQADEGDGSNWCILEAYPRTGDLAGFMQTACIETGLYIVEIRLDREDGISGFWKAGRKEPAGAVTSQGRRGLFKTHENERLHAEEVIAIADCFFTRQECHPDFQWRSIQEDLEQSSKRKPAKRRKKSTS